MFDVTVTQVMQIVTNPPPKKVQAIYIIFHAGYKGSDFSEKITRVSNIFKDKN